MVSTLICVGKHNICIGNREIIMIETAKSNGREYVMISMGLQYSFTTAGILCTVKQKMLVAIVFGSFENITTWQRINLEILLKESGRGPYFFHLVTTNFGKID